MINLNVNNEWEKLNFETSKIKPSKKLFTDFEVNAREYLLKAQVLLSKYENEKIDLNKEQIAKLYLETINCYFQLINSKN